MMVLILTFIVLLTLGLFAVNSDIKRAKQNGKELSEEEINTRTTAIQFMCYVFAFIAVVVIALGF